MSHPHTRLAATRCVTGLALTSALIAAAIPALAAAPAENAGALQPQGVVSLSSSASIEVMRDVLGVSFATTKEGVDAASVQSLLKQALEAATTEAKKVARPGQLDVQTGNFSLSPRYSSKGVLNGWQGSAELIVEGRDMAAIGQLTGRITTLTISRVGYTLSRELREKSEADVSGQAIARYRAKAADYAKQFGYTGYAIREVSVSTNEPQQPMPIATLRMKATSAASDESLPVEPGKGTVTVNVSGTVQLTK